MTGGETENVIYLLILFIGVPLAEMAVLIKVGQWLGVVKTILFVVAAGIFGAFLARQQGFGVIRRIREDLAAGRVPGDSLLDGVLIFIAGILLITPGLLTDAAGFLLLIPQVRWLLKKGIRDRLEKTFRGGRTIHAGYFNRGDS